MHYSPIQYSTPSLWTDESLLVKALSPVAGETWHEARSLQDKRGDEGHARVVTAFTVTLCALHAATPTESEIASLAAILHDTGYANMPDISRRFREALSMQGVFGGHATPQEREQGRTIELEIRREHQERSCEIARKLLSTYRFAQAVEEIIADHDTRRHPPSKAGTFMWDADRLWGFTLYGSNAYFSHCSPDEFLTLLKNQLDKITFYLPDTAHIAHTEMMNTYTLMQEKHNPTP